MTVTMLERRADLWPQPQVGEEAVLDTIQKTLNTAVQDDPANGVYRVRRDIFTDPQIFELEMKHIFEGNWIYLAHESQLPNPNWGRQSCGAWRDARAGGSASGF
jgi:hypothetical protein